MPGNVFLFCYSAVEALVYSWISHSATHFPVYVVVLSVLACYLRRTTTDTGETSAEENSSMTLSPEEQKKVKTELQPLKRSLGTFKIMPV